MTEYLNRRTRRAFTLLELLVVLAVLGVLGMAGGLGVSALARQTARREAERAMHWLYGVLLRADRTGRKFSLRVQEGKALIVDWEDSSERLEATRGCSFERRDSISGIEEAFVTYSPVWGTFTPALTVQVRGAGGDLFFLIISGQGKLRVSPSPWQNEEETKGIII
ncbi:MAG: prepilin-type N-terminal cleavage/methylation domain-containing protein [Fretibacterium sp.]|nr:prepilin-type N-terminal cleavage/methylation domain-containing protein [Fretibacterium sp.]